MGHVFGIPALTKSRFGKNQSEEVLTLARRYAAMHCGHKSKLWELPYLWFVNNEGSGKTEEMHRLVGFVMYAISAKISWADSCILS